MVADVVIAHCPHCGNEAPQRLLVEHRFEDPRPYEEFGRTSTQHVSSCYTIRVCGTCNDLIMYFDDEYGAVGTVYPSRVELHYGVPEAVRARYDEAAKVRPRSPRA